MVFPHISLMIVANLEDDGTIDVTVTQDNIKRPLSFVGTGVLQAIQISAYINGIFSLNYFY